MMPTTSLLKIPALTLWWVITKSTISSSESLTMSKLHVTVYKNFSDIKESLTNKLDLQRKRLFLMYDIDNYNHPKEFNYKDGTKVVEFEDSVTVYVKHDLPAKYIGMLEYYILKHTGMRGESVKISSIEVFEKPNTQLKKYLMRKL